MRPGTYNLDLYRGDTYTWQFTLWKDPLKLEAADLTGVVAEAEIRSSSGTTPVGVMECVVTLPNIVTVHLPAEAWATIPFIKGGWDLQLTYPDESVVTVLAGTVVVTPDITDSGPVTVAASPNVLVSAFSGS